MKRLFAVALLLLAACDPEPKQKAKVPRCPPPPEPDHVATVVATIGKLHLAENRYGLSRMGDVLAAFKPDLVLLAVRPEPFRDGLLEDGSFEMTYAHYLAKARGIPIEPIEWFREQDFEAPAAPLEPFDVTEIERREAEVLGQPRLFTFEQANGDEMMAKVFLAGNAQARYRNGNPLATRRAAWIQSLAASAVHRYNKPRRVLAFVDVFDRPSVDLLLRSIGYLSKNPVEIVARSREVMVSDVPDDVVREWTSQKARVRDRVAKTTGAEKAFWEERQRVLDTAIAKKGGCCVNLSALNAPRP